MNDYPTPSEVADHVNRAAGRIERDGLFQEGWWASDPQPHAPGDACCTAAALAVSVLDECITEQVTRHEAWYAPTIWCCKCGDTWDAEEGRHPRPFLRGWRREAQREARQLWDRATYGPPPTVEDLFGGAS